MKKDRNARLKPNESIKKGFPTVLNIFEICCHNNLFKSATFFLYAWLKDNKAGYTDT